MFPTERRCPWCGHKWISSVEQVGECPNCKGGLPKRFDYELWKLFQKGRMTVQQIRDILKPAVYDVEPELVQLARVNADLLMKRYKKEGILRDWKPNEIETMFLGLLGEQIFQATLYQLRVPHLYTHPLYPHNVRTPHDFEVDGKTLQVKTVKFGDRYRNLLVKIAEWSKSDVVVPIKLVNKDLTRAHIFGYLTGTEVEALPTSDGDYPCFHERCYWCDLENVTKKHSAFDLFKMLKNSGANVTETE